MPSASVPFMVLLAAMFFGVRDGRELQPGE
jgi:hypothetical protein